MRLLLDTHIVLWALGETEKLSQAAKDHLGSPLNQLVVSAVSIWEVSIKHGQARVDQAKIAWSGPALLEQLARIDVELLPVSPHHAAAVDGLRGVHRDPFDRLLVAQAQSESMHLLTHDAKLRGYGDFVLIV